MSERSLNKFRVLKMRRFVVKFITNATVCVISTFLLAEGYDDMSLIASTHLLSPMRVSGLRTCR